MLVSSSPSREKLAITAPASPRILPQLPRLRALKTFNLPPQQVDELVHPASAVLRTPTSETLGETLLRVLIAPSGFKESFGPEQVADAIEAGITNVLDSGSVILRRFPLYDGGEGFAQALVAAHDGIILEESVMGPVGAPVKSHLGFIGGEKTAVLDMAAAAGLRLVPKDERDPTVTTTYGVGELLRKALDAGSTKIIIGCGDSGVARVYGPQRGATPAQVDLLARSLERLAQVAQGKLGRDISQSPGGGASGGLDFQSPNGKMTTETARRARQSGAQMVALAGTIGEGEDGCYGAGIKAFTSILRSPLSLEEAIVQTETLVKDGAEKVMRMILVGLALGRRR